MELLIKLDIRKNVFVAEIKRMKIKVGMEKHWHKCNNDTENVVLQASISSPEAVAAASQSLYEIASAEPLDDEFANPFLSVETPIAEQIGVVNDNADPEPRSDSRWMVDNVDVSSIFIHSKDDHGVKVVETSGYI